MPLPLAHSLMGYTIAESLGFRLSRNVWFNYLILVALANLPDIDFLPGYLLGTPNLYHHHQLHSFGFAALVGALGGAIYWRTTRQFWPYFFAIFSAVSSHMVLDLLTQDWSPPFGMMLFWPLSMEFYDSPWKIFEAVHKSNHSSDFWSSLFQPANLRTVAVELVIMLPLAFAVSMARRLRARRNFRSRAMRATRSGALTGSTSSARLIVRQRRPFAEAAEERLTSLSDFDVTQIDFKEPGVRNGKG